MATLGLVEYFDASPEVRAVYDDIMVTRRIDRINNFWKALAHDPPTLRRTWESIKQIMAPGALDPLTKEMIYVAVSATNQCAYCIASHTAAARKAGMSDAMFAELMAVVGMANETNRLASGYQVELDSQFVAGQEENKFLAKAKIAKKEKKVRGDANRNRVRYPR
jgi:AhpD family alkylhydroperoxidase